MTALTPAQRAEVELIVKGVLGQRGDSDPIDIDEVSRRTGQSPDRIRHLRVKGHELYSRAWKSGRRLLWDPTDVDAWVQAQQAAARRLA